MKNMIKMASAAVLLFTTSAQAGNVLIVHGKSTSSEPQTTQENIDNWPRVCNANNQHTVTYVDSPPTDVTAYDQIWDIRFDNNAALTTAERTTYAAAITANRSIFLMGENSGFATRNASVVDFIAQLGGGQLTMQGGTDSQQVNAPLNINGVSTVQFNHSGYASASGLTGVMATEDIANSVGSAFYWERGTLGSTQGKLAVVFDVNFMMTSYGAGGNNGAFFANLCENLALPIPSVVANPDTVSNMVTAGQATIVDVLSNDVPTGDTLNPTSVSIVAQPTQGSISGIDPANGQITYLPSTQATGPESFSYQVCLTNNPTTCATATVNLTIAPLAPTASLVANNDTVSSTITAGHASSIDILSNDVPTGDTLNPASVTIVTQPGQGSVSVDPATGLATYLPNPQASGADSFSYQVCLNNYPTTCATASVNLNVTAGQPIATQIQPVPSLSTWGLGLLSLLMSICMLYRKRMS